jgi:tetratricopeptide (TPR) repeat protein
MADKKNIWLDSIKKLPGWIMGLIAFVTAVVGFINLWQGDSSLVTIVLLAVGVGGGWLGCAYLTFKRTSPLVEGGKGTWKYPRWRPWAMAGLVIIPLLAAGGVGYYWFLQTRPPDKIIVLVADFDGVEPQRYRVTETVLVRLQDALEPYDDVDVYALGRMITGVAGSTAARSEGEKHKAAIFIWGWYGVTVEAVSLSAHFEVLRPLQHLPEVESDERGPFRTLAVAELENFRLQSRLSVEMSYLSLFTIGMARYSAEDWEGAIDRFSAALDQIEEERVPELDRSFAYFYRGLAYGAIGNHDQSIADYNQAIELNPGIAQAYNNRGNAYIAKRKLVKAISDYNRAIELDPDIHQAYTNRGISFAALGDYELAISDYNRAIELDPDDVSIYYLRGSVNATKGDYDQAIADFDRAIELDPDTASAYYSRGLVYATKGDYDQAIADYQTYLSLDPESPERKEIEKKIKSLQER